MKNLFTIVFIIGLFLGCARNEPTLPKSYENISFDELMKNLNNEKIVDGVYRSNWLNNIEGKKFMEEPFEKLCLSKKGTLKSDGVGLYNNFKYCTLSNQILFGYWKKINGVLSQYSFNGNSEAITNGFKIEQEKEIKLVKIRNKVQLVNDKIENFNKNLLKDREIKVSKNLKEIRDNARHNSEKDTYLKKNFKSIDGIYYFTIYGIVKNDFIAGYEKEARTKEFTEEVINSITTRYVLKIRDIDLKNIVSNNQIINEFRDSKTINKKYLLTIGVKNLGYPFIYKECSKNYQYDLYSNTSNIFILDTSFTNLFENNENQIRNYKSVYCLKDYSMNVELEEMFLLDYGQIKNYTFVNNGNYMKDELKKLETEEFNMKHNE